MFLLLYIHQPTIGLHEAVMESDIVAAKLMLFVQVII